jgi:uncharacterized membrane protein YphA (DoxX/SURF4 family)
MSVVVLIGRILFAGLFISSGIAHLTQTKQMAGYAKMKGIPAAPVATIVSGLMVVVGGLMVLLGIWADLGGLLIAAFCIPTAILMHGFWKETDPQAKQMEMIQFNKDLALGGAGLIVLGLVSIAGSELGLTLTGPLF